LPLAASLLAMLGRWWLDRYVQVEVRWSVIDRSRHRQRKMNGMVTWHFDLVMECLPLMLQAALLLLSYALSEYLYSINRTVASVAIGFTSFGLLFYLLIVSAATLSYNCPFQTPISLILHFLIRFDDEHEKYLKRSRKWFGRMFSQKKTRPRARSGVPHGLGRFGVFDGSDLGDHIELFIAANQPPPLFDKETDWTGHVLDSNCIAWIFEMSMDADVIMAIMRFIPEVVWHAGIRTAPLERLYGTVLECFDRSSGRPVVVPKLRNKALLRLTMGSKHYDEDSDLESTLGITDRVFGDFKPMYWQNFPFTIPHHALMGHILLHCAWDALRIGEPLSDDVKDFVLHSLRMEPPPAPIVADCLLTIGIKLHIDDQSTGRRQEVNQIRTHSLWREAKPSCCSHECSHQINRIFDKLTEMFRNPTHTNDEIDRALEVMELIGPLSENDISQKSYDLFHVIMQAPVSLAYTQEKKWEASRLAMHGAYKWDEFLPWVEDPQDILTFLDHNFDLADRGGQDQREPIQNALRALAYASGSATIEDLKRFDPTEPSFVRGICYVFQGDKPSQLHKAALFFLPLIGDGWFNTSIKHTYDVQKATLSVLFGMISSPHWRPHIVMEKWKLLEYFTSVPDGSVPLMRCIDNPELMDVIRNVADPAAMVLWLAIL